MLAFHRHRYDAAEAHIDRALAADPDHRDARLMRARLRVQAWDLDDAEGFLREMGGEAYPSVVDVDGRHAVDWGTFGIPETFVVDDTGTVRARLVGEVTPQWIDQHVVPLLER